MTSSVGVFPSPVSTSTNHQGVISPNSIHMTCKADTTRARVTYIMIGGKDGTYLWKKKNISTSLLIFNFIIKSITCTIKYTHTTTYNALTLTFCPYDWPVLWTQSSVPWVLLFCTLIGGTTIVLTPRGLRPCTAGEGSGATIAAKGGRLLWLLLSR